MKKFGIPVSLEANIKVIFIPFVTTIACITIFSLLGLNGYKRVVSRLTELRELGKTEKLLQNKVDVLRNIPEGILDKADVALIVLPESNAATYSVAQIRKLIVEYNFTINKIDTKIQGNKEGSEKALITFEISYDDELRLMELLGKIQSIAPLTRIEALIVKTINNVGVAEIELVTYGLDLPSQLPAITEPIVSLNENEIDTLDLMSGLTMPQTTKLDKKEFINRNNPFQ